MKQLLTPLWNNYRSSTNKSSLSLAPCLYPSPVCLPIRLRALLRLLSSNLPSGLVTSCPLILTKFSGEVGNCGEFLLQCSLVFNRPPQYFSHDGAKVSFVLSLLTGRALRWAEARFTNINNIGYTFDEFLTEFKQTFSPTYDQASDLTEDSYCLL
uniref:DUF4939 domain-containing protein n=1 Tax=Kryptolebias marmoratus TaxID=37003 RepID=A0A3Q3ANQ7_KRYMA